jgi:hypothetical protein
MGGDYGMVRKMVTRLGVLTKMPFPHPSALASLQLRFLCLLGTLLMVTKAENAEAHGPLSLFRSAVQAHQHCPNDTVVWLDLQRRIYYVQGQRQYGRGRTATFVCREEARRNGNRRSLLGRR